MNKVINTKQGQKMKKHKYLNECPPSISYTHECTPCDANWATMNIDPNLSTIDGMDTTEEIRQRNMKAYSYHELTGY